MKVVTTEEMRQIERAADASGLSFAQMMENAGRAVAETITARGWADPSGPVLILCGPGNNGGDGLVAAWLLAEAGLPVRAYCVKRPADGDANRARAIAAGVSLVDEADDVGHGIVRTWLAEAALIVDALLGTGASLPLREPIRSVLALAREVVQERRAQPSAQPATIVPITGRLSAPPPASPALPRVVAVDCPSGLDCDTGALDPDALSADLTVTFAFPKVGHFNYPGAAALGELLVADIGVPAALAADVAVELATPDAMRALLPARPANAHKGTFGKALIIAGSITYIGAAYLAGAAAVRAGVGLVTMATPRSLQPVLASTLHETVWLGLPHEMGVIVADACRLLDEKLADHQALLIGPGLSQEKEAVEFVREFLLGGRAPQRGRSALGFLPRVAVEEAPAPASQRPPLPPAVIDADALNILAQTEEWSVHLPHGCILTPHPGEMGRLCQISAQEVNHDRLGLARRQAAAWGQVILLKGAYTVVASPDGHATILPFANPGLAKGGSGDVLAGILVALLAQGLTPTAAAVLGAYMHGLAGELARQELGEIGMTPSDLIRHLPGAWRALAG